jgi:hypothetical protein
MRKSTGKPTKSQAKRFERFNAIGCIACRKTGNLFCGPVEAHHLNLGGRAGQKRRGHDYTIPLGQWHHRGLTLPGRTLTDMREVFGPSLARQSKAFREFFGSDDQLLAEVNQLLGIAA